MQEMKFSEIVSLAQAILYEARSSNLGPEYIRKECPKHIPSNLWDRAVTVACKLEDGRTVTIID